MSNTIWVVEFRHRSRKNGRWPEWQPMGPDERPLTAYREFPTDQILQSDKYERRAIPYTRNLDAALVEALKEIRKQGDEHTGDPEMYDGIWASIRAAAALHEAGLE